MVLYSYLNRKKMKKKGRGLYVYVQLIYFPIYGRKLKVM